MSLLRETIPGQETVGTRATSELFGERLDRPQKTWDWRPAVLLLVTLLVRVLYVFTFKPWWGLDSEHYSTPMVEWAQGYFSDGTRTPVYPLFLGICQWLAGVRPATPLSISSAAIVRDLQCAFGLIAVYLFYETLRTLRIRSTVAFIAALFFSLVTPVCAVEMAILTISLSVFSVVLGIWLYAKMMQRISQERNGKRLAIFFGLAIAFSSLVRPDNLVFFVVILVISAIFAIRSRFIPARAAMSRPLLVCLLLIAVSTTPFLLAWMTWNYIGTARFRMTNMMGIQMSQPVYNMFDQVDPEDKVLGSIMTKYYRIYNQHEINREYMWRGMGELTNRAWEMPYHSAADDPRGKFGNWVYNLASNQSRLKYNLYTVGFIDYLRSVDMKLIKKNPLGYLQNGVDSFVRDSFDFVPKFPAPDETIDPRAVEGGSVLKNRSGLEIIRWVGIFEAPFLTVFYLVTLACVLFGPLILLRSRNDVGVGDVVITALATGTVGTFGAFCLLESYHPQYGIPHVSILVICAAYAVDNFDRIRSAIKSSSA